MWAETDYISFYLVCESDMHTCYFAVQLLLFGRGHKYDFMLHSLEMGNPTHSSCMQLKLQQNLFPRWMFSRDVCWSYKYLGPYCIEWYSQPHLNNKNIKVQQKLLWFLTVFLHKIWLNYDSAATKLLSGFILELSGSVGQSYTAHHNFTHLTSWMICRAMSCRPPFSSATSERSEDTQLSTWSSWFLSSSCCSGDRPCTTASTAARACCWASVSAGGDREEEHVTHVGLDLFAF